MTAALLVLGLTLEPDVTLLDADRLPHSEHVRFLAFHAWERRNAIRYTLQLQWEDDSIWRIMHVADKLDETERLLKVYEDVLTAKSQCRPTEARLAALRRVRDAIGPERWLAGALPTPW